MPCCRPCRCCTLWGIPCPLSPSSWLSPSSCFFGEWNFCWHVFRAHQRWKRSERAPSLSIPFDRWRETWYQRSTERYWEILGHKAQWDLESGTLKSGYASSRLGNLPCARPCSKFLIILIATTTHSHHNSTRGIIVTKEIQKLPQSKLVSIRVRILIQGPLTPISCQSFECLLGARHCFKHVTCMESFQSHPNQNSDEF